MLKLLYKPTRNIFTLPDEEAIRIKNNDYDDNYVIMEAGLQKEETKTITKVEVKAIEEERKKAIEETEKADKEAEEVKEKKKSTFFKTYDMSDLRKLPKKDLVILANKLGFFDMDNCTVEEIISYIEGNKKKTLKTPGRKKVKK